MGARTDAARAAAVASRGELVEEVARLEAAGRAAVDIPAQVRKAPARTAGVAASAAFLAAGGPKRVFRGVRRAIRGPEADMPRTMLPKEVDKTLRKLGKDGEKVRGTIEREFADYLEEHSQERKKRDLGATAALLGGTLLGPTTRRLGQRLAEELFDPRRAGQASFEDALIAPAAVGVGTMVPVGSVGRRRPGTRAPERQVRRTDETARTVHAPAPDSGRRQRIGGRSSMTRGEWLLAVAVAICGVAIAYVDTRPRFDDTGIIVGAVTLLAAVAGVIGRRRPWLWAIVAGAWVPLLEITGGGHPESLVALVFAGLGAAAGYALASALGSPSVAR